MEKYIISGEVVEVHCWDGDTKSLNDFLGELYRFNYTWADQGARVLWISTTKNGKVERLLCTLTDWITKGESGISVITNRNFIANRISVSDAPTEK